MKVVTRNYLLKILASSKWGTNATTIRTTALALCYSIAEYAAPVWEYGRLSETTYCNLTNNYPPCSFTNWLYFVQFCRGTFFYFVS